MMAATFGAPGQMAAAPGGGATRRADDLLAMTQRLAALVAEEITALNERRLDNSTAHWDEKERLVHAWRLEVSRIKADPTLLAGIDPTRKEALKQASLALETALEGHAHALSAMKDVTEGLVRSIAAEIASVRGAPQGYGRSGAIVGSTPAGAGLAVDAKI